MELGNPPTHEDSLALEAYLKTRYPQIKHVSFALSNPVPLQLYTSNYAQYLHDAFLVLEYVGKNLIQPVLIALTIKFLERRGKRVEVGGKVKGDIKVDELARERGTMRRIREALATARLKEPFRAKDVNSALGITYAGTFLPKHRVGNPSKNTEHFILTARGLYRLKNPN